MKRASLTSVMAIIFLLFVQFIHAEVKLPAIVSSNMVLQRNTTVVLWGWADAKEEITIKASWQNEQLNVKADKTGSWSVEVKTTNSKDPQNISIKSATSDISLENILFGEVWLCSGQSNMQQPITGYNGQPTFGSSMAVANGSNPNLRLFTVDRIGSKIPETDVEKYTPWEEASHENVADFSAIAYFFGQQLHKIPGILLELIQSTWGSSVVEARISNKM